MKLRIIIVWDIDAENIIQAFVENDFRITRISSTGGFLRHGNVTLMTGVEEDKVQA